MDKKLYRDRLHGVRGGVCAGLAEYFQIDASIVRILFIVSVLLHGIGIPLYIILWVVLPQKPYQIINTTVDYTVPQGGFEPIPPVFNRPKQPSNVAVMAGAILILIGGSCLLNEFDLMPDIEFKYIYPLIFIGIGIAVLFTGKDKKPWDNANWNTKEKVEDFKTESTTTDNNNTTTI